MQILVTDDDATSRLLVAASVRAHGHEILLTEDGTQAWECFLQHRPDVILTDRRMPGLDGLELVRRIRETSDGHRAYVVLITALGARDEVLAGMEAGADDYLVKPVDPFDLQIRLMAAERSTTLHRRLAEVAAALSRANEDLRLLARTDRLTEVGNRLRLEEDLSALHARAQRDGQTYSVALADVDHFKTYNDTYGHPAGDGALRAIATALHANARDGDRVYRYGGEELAVLMPATGTSAAMTAATRLRISVEELAIPHIVEPSRRLTISIGVAGFDPGRLQDSNEVVERADQALYRAKAAGRNQISA